MNVSNVPETQTRNRMLWSQRGSTAVEFALILPVIATMLFGVIDFGRLLYTKEVLSNAVREAARTGIVATAGGDVSSAVIDAALTTSIQNSQLVNPADIANIQQVKTGPVGNRNLSVTVNYNFNFLVVGGLIPGLTTNQTLSSTSIMRMEI